MPARANLAGERAAEAARGDNWPAKRRGFGPSDCVGRYTLDRAVLVLPCIPWDKQGEMSGVAYPPLQRQG